jgi:DNA modification methylase
MKLVTNYETVKIDQIKEVESFKNFYENPSENLEFQLSKSIESNGQLIPVAISSDFILIDGYRRLNSLRGLGIDEVKVQFTTAEPTLDSRLLYNMYRLKTDKDLTNEVLQIFKSVPKKQGKRNDGVPYDRYQLIIEKLDNRWTSPTAIRQLDKIIDGDFDNHLLLNGIVTKGWNIKDCEEYVDTLKTIDLEKNHGFSDKLFAGELTIKQTNSFITNKEFLSNEYQDTFIIPGKSSSFNINCSSIDQLTEFKNAVNTLFTSIPYYELRGYENGDGENQIGHEKTPEEFADRIGKIFKSFEYTLNETSNVMINVGESYRDGCALGIPRLITDSVLKNTSLKFKDQLVWSKPNPHPQGEKLKRPINNLEYILWFVVDPAKAKYNLLTYTDSTKKTKLCGGVKDVNKNGVVMPKEKTLTKHYKKIYSHLSAQDVDHMIRCAAGKNIPAYNAFPTGHPALMAELLPVIPILMTTDENDLVFDPFGGANTSGRISLLLNRGYLSTELSTHYYKVGCKVLENTLKEINYNDLSLITNEFISDRSLSEAA